MDAGRLRSYNLRKDKLLRNEKLNLLRRWCEIAEHALLEHTFFQQLERPSASSLTELIQKGRIEWFVHLPHLFEKYVRRRLGALLDAHPSLRHLAVIKPRGVPHKHFADKTANPDLLVREKASRNAVALYDVKLYKRAGKGPQNNHHHQVESDVLSFNAGAGNIVHAGLVYGFWEGDGFDSAEWKIGCYHACVRGPEEDVSHRIDYALRKLVRELAEATGVFL